MEPAENHFYKDYLWKGTCTVDLLEFGRMNGKIMVVLIACGRICEFRLQMQPRMVKKNSKKKKNGTIHDTIHQPVELTAHHMLEVSHIRVFTNVFETKKREQRFCGT